MSERTNTPSTCRNIFRNGGTHPTKKEYTHIWISIINQLERRKGGVAGLEK